MIWCGPVNIWRGQRGVSCALQTSIRGEPLSTVTAPEQSRGALATRTHKRSSPRQPTGMQTPPGYGQT
ncbi:hypothetical protein OJAV_G00113370 [Oryzias javanicus]|uniref:Uncharacterized protein n=1 Tax=Oryzias javanicus TaxID=123683 RepID=A0A3S2PQB6_ORYJA|nr:hypothetical protein OJAV_G00113370 [Oryzias javanicus]